MAELASNNKRIAKNTVFLYIRMLLVMGVTLFTSRVVLQVLGEENYGIYNVVGGVVAMFSFFTSTLASTSQRYFSYYIGQENEDALIKIFRLNLTAFLILALFIVILAESVGLWFINSQLNIPEERMFAMNIVYQCSVLTFVCAVVLVPYNALIISFEKMSAFAYISIVEVTLKLLLTVSLFYFGGDKLIIYAVLMLLSQIVITYYYYYYCRRHFQDIRYRFYWNREKISEVMSYSGWHLIGAISVMIRNQGVNILLNTFFNPIVNAGRAIGFQVTAATDSLSHNFFLAAKPQLYKYYALNDFEELHKLLIRTTKVCVFLIVILAVPILTNTRYILSLWLVNVPSYAVIFTQLALVNAIFDATNGPAIAAALATARIKWFEIITGGLMILNLPVSYLILYFGGTPESTVLVSIVLSLITIVIRAYILKRMIYLPVKKYLVNACFMMFLVALLSYMLTSFFNSVFNESFVRFVVTSFFSILVNILLFYGVALNHTEKHWVINNFINRILRRRK